MQEGNRENPTKKPAKLRGTGLRQQQSARPLPSVGMTQTGSKGRAIALSAENRHPQRQMCNFVLSMACAQVLVKLVLRTSV